MQPRHGILGGLLAAFVTLAACSGSETPSLMNIRAGADGPDEFALVPTKPLEMPDSMAELPEPTPGAGNRADPQPRGDAVAALGGNARAGSQAPEVVAYAARHGSDADIRGRLAAEDEEYRRRNRGRLLERVFNRNTYYDAYSPMALDRQRELDRWRAAGARTPAAPAIAD